MPESFGARLRQRREERQIDLVSIAKQTKINPALLEALERDDVSLWPSGFYRRAFIRAYAQAIDLDPDVVVREFLEVHPEPPAVDVIAAMASTLGGGDRSGRPGTNRVRSVVDLALGSLSRLRRGEPEPAAAPSSAPAPAQPAPQLESPSDRLPYVPVAPVSTAEVAAGSHASPEEGPVSHRAACQLDLMAVAQLCTDFALVRNALDVQPLLQQASSLLNAGGIIVWLWDTAAAELEPALVHGYAPPVVAQLPRLPQDADNATALAFRSAQMCAIAATDEVSGALVAPLLTPSGCTGVLAIELRRGTEQTPATRAVATILAALLAQMTIHSAPVERERLA